MELSRQYRRCFTGCLCIRLPRNSNYLWERFLYSLSIILPEVPPVSERTPRDFSCSYRGGRKRINGRHRKEAICHDSCQRIYDRYGTLSFFSYCNRPDLCHASGKSSTGNTTKAFCYSTDRSVFSADAPIHIHLSAVYADFSKCRYLSVDSCTARVESLISAVAVGEGISLFAESNFRLFQHEGVISVPLEESPVLRIGFAYKKAGEYTPAMDCFLHFMADSQKY